MFKEEKVISIEISLDSFVVTNLYTVVLLKEFIGKLMNRAPISSVIVRKFYLGMLNI